MPLDGRTVHSSKLTNDILTIGEKGEREIGEMFPQSIMEDLLDRLLGSDYFCTVAGPLFVPKDCANFVAGKTKVMAEKASREKCLWGWGPTFFISCRADLDN